MTKNVLVISGTRADFGLLESTISEIKKSKTLSLLLLLTGMHTLRGFGNTQDEVRAKGYDVSGVVPISENGDMISWLGEEIKGINEFCSKNRVDCILVLGDRDEMLAGAIVGTHQGIPVGHIHGGDLSGESVVDSKNRDAITELATFHFAATENSEKRISQMIGSHNNVFVVGAPGIDLFLKMPKVSRKAVAKKFNLELGKRWLLVVMHPTPLSQLSGEEQIKPLLEVFSSSNDEIIWVYPNSDTGSDIFIKEIEGFSKRKGVKLYKNLPREDFIGFLSTVDVMVGNSSSGIIESTYFNFPVVNIGDRQEGRERLTNVIDCDYNKKAIIEAINLAFSNEFKDKARRAKRIYGKGNVGKKIVEILEKKL